MGGKREPSELHRNILSLFGNPESLRVVTTNFDSCFESAAGGMGMSPRIYISPALPLGNDFSGLIHLHGSTVDPNSQILTDVDFGRAYITDGWASHFLVRMFSTYKTLFVGYSCGDMRFENDYTSKRIETDQQIIEKMEEDYKLVRGDAHRRLSEKISRVKGIPLVIAEARADGYEPRDPVADTLHLAAVRMDRVNPLRMHEAAKRKLSEQKASLQDEITTENTVRTIADQYEAELDKIDFAFNKADTMLIKGDTVQLLSTAPEGKNRK